MYGTHMDGRFLQEIFLNEKEREREREQIVFNYFFDDIIRERERESKKEEDGKK